LHMVDNSPLSDVICKLFFPLCGLSSLDIVFHRDGLNFNKIQLAKSLFHEWCLWCCI
jgi:hypothetical protein